MKILMVLTSHEDLGDTGEKTGFWLEEFAAPYYVLRDAGAEITLASPKGGQPPLDPKSDADDAQTDATRRFKKDADAQQALAATQKLSGVIDHRPEPRLVRGSRARTSETSKIGQQAVVHLPSNDSSRMASDLVQFDRHLVDLAVELVVGRQSLQTRL